MNEFNNNLELDQLNLQIEDMRKKEESNMLQSEQEKEEMS